MAAMQEGAGLGLEAFSPTEVEKRVEDAACAKAALPMGRCFGSAMLAGAFIAFGGMFFCTFLSDATLPFAVQRLVGGVCFCLGLVLVLCCGAELFTGNVLMGGHWEYLLTDEPTKYQAALAMGGWRRL